MRPQIDILKSGIRFRPVESLERTPADRSTGDGGAEGYVGRLGSVRGSNGRAGSVASHDTGIIFAGERPSAAQNSPDESNSIHGRQPFHSRGSVFRSGKEDYPFVKCSLGNVQIPLQSDSFG